MPYAHIIAESSVAINHLNLEVPQPLVAFYLFLLRKAIIKVSYSYSIPKIGITAMPYCPVPDKIIAIRREILYTGSV